MRTNEFVFKKTKKIVTKYQGISVDLTVQECVDLLAMFGSIDVTTECAREFVGPLLSKLRAFVGKQPFSPEPRVTLEEV